MRQRLLFILVLSLALAGCNRHDSSHEVDLLLRSSIDGHNKAAFVNRYQDPQCAIHEAYMAAMLVHDSLPAYTDGLLRAYNNLAFDFYMLAEHDSASAYIDSVMSLTASASHHNAKNTEVERVLAQLMHIRLLQRSCCIAESYQLLYDLEDSPILRGSPDDYLTSLAQMEYYITTLTLNYHYRNSAVASSSGTLLTSGTKQTLHEMLQQVEEVRPQLRCDYAEDLSLNYALAHSYYRLAAASGSDPGLLAKCYNYLADNLRILSSRGQGSVYHLANVFQLEAFIAADTNIIPEAYIQHCCAELALCDSLASLCFPIGTKGLTASLDPQAAAQIASIDSLAALIFSFDTDDTYFPLSDYGLDLFQLSTALFFLTPDPYQHLGAVVAAGEYCQSIGAIDSAHRYYEAILRDTSWHDGMAPKFEAMLYDGLIRTGYSTSAQENMRWYNRQMELLSFIRQNESADVNLQDRLHLSESKNRSYALAILVTLALTTALAVALLLLRRRSKILKAETLALQEAKRKDVERIANVETCLSVMRHDVNPFLSYLTNKKLSDEMRQEVLQQLLRTFSNIKSWTNLSIPSGLQFQSSHFPLQEVFDSVGSTCANIHDEVVLTFEPTDLAIWGDRQLMEILLRNLVNNALQHTQQGSITVSAEPLEEDTRFVHIAVSDTGTGMDEETLDNLFRADKKVVADADLDAPHGTGFGLILCKYIIKRHDDNTLRGCRIWAESQLGKGSTFHCAVGKGKVEN